MIINGSNNPPTTANIQLGLWVSHQSLLAACTEPTLTPSILLHSPHYNTPVTITALINYHFLVSSFVIAEEDLRIKTSYPFNEVTAVFLLNNPRYHHTSHSAEPYHIIFILVYLLHLFIFILVYLLHLFIFILVYLLHLFIFILVYLLHLFITCTCFYACLFLCTLCV